MDAHTTTSSSGHIVDQCPRCGEFGFFCCHVRGLICYQGHTCATYTAPYDDRYLELSNIVVPPAVQWQAPAPTIAEQFYPTPPTDTDEVDLSPTIDLFSDFVNFEPTGFQSPPSDITDRTPSPPAIFQEPTRAEVSKKSAKAPKKTTKSTKAPKQTTKVATNDRITKPTSGRKRGRPRKQDAAKPGELKFAEIDTVDTAYERNKDKGLKVKPYVGIAPHGRQGARNHTRRIEILGKGAEAIEQPGMSEAEIEKRHGNWRQKDRP